MYANQPWMNHSFHSGIDTIRWRPVPSTRILQVGQSAMVIDFRMILARDTPPAVHHNFSQGGCDPTHWYSQKDRT